MFSTYQQKTLFFSCLILVIGLAAMDFINPSLPYILKDLHATQAQIKGLMIVYLMALGVAQFFYGTLSDNRGRRIAILWSFVIAIAGFVISAFSINLTMLYTGRFITALGTAGCPVISRALISDVCQNQTQLKKYFSYFSMSSQLSSTLAPVMGGMLQQALGWHYAFAGIAIINVLVFFWLYCSMPETHAIPNTKKYLLDQINIYIALFKARNFMIFNLLSSLVFIFTIGFYSLTPFIFHALGFSALQNGLFYSVYATGIVSGAFSLSTWLSKNNSQKTFLTILYIYPLLFIVAIGLFHWLHDPLWLILLFSWVLAFLCGVSAPLILLLCMTGFTENRGAASAVQSFVKMFFTGVGLLCFNFVILSNFFLLSLIFLIISSVMLILYTAVVK